MRLIWLQETASILISLLLLYTLSSLLSVFDGRPVFEWRGITLNTVVSVLSTASKAALLYAMSQLISQWKWILFTRESRPLLDFERIDAASRGPMGSMMLIWERRSVGYLYLGALVMIFSIAADPFTQQLIQYEQRVDYTDDRTTTVNRAGRFAKGSRANEYSIEDPYGEFSPQLNAIPENLAIWVKLIRDKRVVTIVHIGVTIDVESVIVDADLAMQSAILYGLDRPIKDVVQQGTFNCATGNCTWPIFESLAVCNRCIDISRGIQRIVSNGSQFPDPTASHDAGTAFRLPNGLYIDNTNDKRPDLGKLLHGSIMLATLGTDNASQTTSKPEVDNLIWSMSMLHAEENRSDSLAVWPNLPVSAIECALFYCVKRYNISVTNGIIRGDSEQVANITRVPGSWRIPQNYVNAIYPWGYNNSLTESQISSIAFDNLTSTLPRSDLALLAPASGAHFNISQNAVDSISNHYQSMFAPIINTFTIGDDPPMVGRFNGYCERSEREGSDCEPSVMQTLLSSTDLNATFTALAASMSNALRTGADQNFEGMSITVTGKRGDTITYYRIVWPWICLHCLIVIVGAAFLGVTICENWRHGRQMAPLWKSSSLAIATHCDVVADVLSGVKTVKEMREKAGAAKVMLAEPTGGGSSSQELLRWDTLEDAS